MDIYALRVCLTNDEKLESYPQVYRTPGQVVEYLHQDPRHAVVIVDADTSVNNGEARGPVYVLCGAGETSDNYYYGWHPAEDPNEADGGNLTAEQAVLQAVAQIKGITI